MIHELNTESQKKMVDGDKNSEKIDLVKTKLDHGDNGSEIISTVLLPENWYYQKSTLDEKINEHELVLQKIKNRKNGKGLPHIHDWTIQNGDYNRHVITKSEHVKNQFYPSDDRLVLFAVIIGGIIGIYLISLLLGNYLSIQ